MHLGEVDVMPFAHQGMMQAANRVDLAVGVRVGVESEAWAPVLPAVVLPVQLHKSADDG